MTICDTLLYKLYHQHIFGKLCPLILIRRLQSGSIAKWPEILHSYVLARIIIENKKKPLNLNVLVVLGSLRPIQRYVGTKYASQVISITMNIYRKIPNISPNSLTLMFLRLSSSWIYAFLKIM